MHLNEKLLKELPEQTEKYIHTRFNIEAGYRWGSGMPQNQMNQFYKEIKDLFTAAGWSVDEGSRSCVAPTVRFGSSSLYCHPMELSGPCSPKLYPMVIDILSKATTCNLMNIETLEPVFNLSTQEYEKVLGALQKDIEKDLLEVFSTAHPMQYTSEYYDRLDSVAAHYRIPTLTSYIGVSSQDPHIRYISQAFNNLVREGKILCKENQYGHKMYRSITGAERLELARKAAAKLNHSQNKTNTPHQTKAQNRE